MSPARPAHLHPHPMVEFAKWWAEAGTDEVALATAGPDGDPSVRFVLLRGLDWGPIFFTNHRSHKGRDLLTNPRAELVLRVPPDRQVRVHGSVSRVDRDETVAYWRTRDRTSQLSAWASPQSQRIRSRTWLEDQVAELEARFQGLDVPAPAHWGGFRMMPDRVEFWQQGEHRLHHRWQYRRVTGSWVVELLGP